MVCLRAIWRTDSLVNTVVWPRINTPQLGCTPGSPVTVCKCKHFCLFFFLRFGEGSFFWFFYLLLFFLNILL